MLRLVCELGYEPHFFSFQNHTFKVKKYLNSMINLFCERSSLMEQNDEKFLILEQYRIYSDAKERFIDRQFGTNKFYLVLNIIILVAVNILATLTPQYAPVIVGSIIGVSTTIMWWMNIDSYQMLIKVKYAKVLEYLETKLPEQPYHKEFIDYCEMKKKNNLIVFGDFQKALTLIIACVYFVIITYNITNMIRDFSMFNL